MSLWAILAAPLLAGNDLSKMDDTTKSILMNKDVIAVDQDSLGIQGDRVSATGPYEIWMKPLRGGAKAVALFNRSEAVYPITLKLKDVGLSDLSMRAISGRIGISGRCKTPTRRRSHGTVSSCCDSLDKG